MFGLGPLEILLIGAIAVMLYGKRLPEVGRSVGQSLAELRRQWSTISRDLDVAGRWDAPVKTDGGGRAASHGREARRLDDDSGGVATLSAPRFDPPAE
jgi:Sec-independent protein translocase protein TatA